MNFHRPTKNVSNVFHNKSARPKRKNEKKQSGFAFFLNGDGEDGSSCQERTESRLDSSSAVSTARNIRKSRSHLNHIGHMQWKDSEDIERLKLPIEM